MRNRSRFVHLVRGPDQSPAGGCRANWPAGFPLELMQPSELPQCQRAQNPLIEFTAKRPDHDAQMKAIGEPNSILKRWSANKMSKTSIYK